MPPCTAQALTRPLFTDQDFVPTQFSTAADKAAFANALCRFVAADFREALFTNRFYQRLSLCFGHIAHGNREGFAAVFFHDLRGKVAFLEETLGHPCYGDPAFTYSDVERAVIARLRAGDVLNTYRARRAAEIDAAERALLAQLRAKYDGVPIPPCPAPPAAPQIVRPRNRHGGQAGEQQSFF